MQALAEDKMSSVWAQDLVLQAKEGDLRFVQVAKCYIQSRPRTGANPLLLGSAKAENVSEDGRSLKFHVDSGADLAGLLKGPFTIVVEIEGDVPNSKTSIFANLSFKAHILLR